jgi:hypothetical protein
MNYNLVNNYNWAQYMWLSFELSNTVTNVDVTNFIHT